MASKPQPGIRHDLWQRDLLDKLFGGGWPQQGPNREERSLVCVQGTKGARPGGLGSLVQLPPKIKQTHLKPVYVILRFCSNMRFL